MPPDSAATTASAGREINKEGNGRRPKRRRPPCRRREMQEERSPGALPPVPSPTHRSRDLRGGAAVRVIKCRSMRAHACFVVLLTAAAAAVFLEPHGGHTRASGPAVVLADAGVRVVVFTKQYRQNVGGK